MQTDIFALALFFMNQAHQSFSRYFRELSNLIKIALFIQVLNGRHLYICFSFRFTNLNLYTTYSVQ
jgi:hypothetical protein